MVRTDPGQTDQEVPSPPSCRTKTICIGRSAPSIPDPAGGGPGGAARRAGTPAGGRGPGMPGLGAAGRDRRSSAGAGAGLETGTEGPLGAGGGAGWGTPYPSAAAASGLHWPISWVPRRAARSPRANPQPPQARSPGITFAPQRAHRVDSPRPAAGRNEVPQTGHEVWPSWTSVPHVGQGIMATPPRKRASRPSGLARPAMLR